MWCLIVILWSTKICFWGTTLRIFALPLKAIEFNVCKDLKKTFSKFFFWILINVYPFFVNCKSVWVRKILQLSTETPIILFSEFIFWRLVYLFDATRLRNFSKKILDTFVNYPKFDFSHWFREEVQRIIDKLFRETLMVWRASTFSSHSFLLNFSLWLYLLLFS